jgi:hypothetical protein
VRQGSYPAVVLDAYTFALGGKLDEKQTLLLPVARELAAELDAHSLADTPDGLRIPWGRTESGPTMDLGGVTEFGLHLAATGTGGWMVKKAWDELYDNVVRPKLRALLLRRRSEGWDHQPLTVNLGLWYQRDGFYIGVSGELAEDRAEHSLDLFADAQAKGLAWVEEHGVTKPVLIYVIRDGKLPSVPTILDAVP